MKSLKIVLVALICVVTVTTASAQMKKKVQGSGEIATEERKESGFTGVSTSSAIDVFINQGTSFKVTVEADDNILEYIITEVKDGVLRVHPAKNISIRRAKMMNVYVTMKEIDYLSSSSAGDIIAETAIKAEDLKIKTSSSGDVKAEVYVKNLYLSTSSAGDIILKGTADFVDASSSSAGDIKAIDLSCKVAELTASSAGDIKITVSEKVTARASSAGDVHIYGDPDKVDARSSSAGSVIRK